MASVAQPKSRRAVDTSKLASDTKSSHTKSMNGSLVEIRKIDSRGKPANKAKYGKMFIQPDQDESLSTTLAVAYTVLPSWLSTLAMLSLIFGGCCANVFALEGIIQVAPNSGTLITAMQFLLTSLFTLPSHLDLSRGLRNLYLRPRAIPLRTWLIYTTLFLTINILNNAAFSYKISVPLHIILRSAGPVATMGIGYLSGRRYTRTQVLAVFLLFLGVVQAAIADARAKGAQLKLFPTSDTGSERSTSEFWTGFSLLYLALMLSAVMGVFSDRIYAHYGRNHTLENLFYSHTLSLPFFLLRLPDLRAQSRAIITSPSFLSYFSATTLHSGPVQFIQPVMSKIPVQLVFLLINACTQYLCIRGVNQLSARSSSLTVGIVLNIRKLVSLLLSIWLFGNELAPGVLIGAAIVFIGGGLYALPSSSKPSPTPTKKEKEPKKEL